MSSWREDCLNRLTRPNQSPQLVFAELGKLFADLGFEFCSLGVRAPAYGSESAQIWLTNYPQRWQKTYMGHNYLTVDPVIAAALHSPMPVVWNDELLGNQRDFWENARAHGVCHGWTLAMHGMGAELGLLSLARSDDPVTDAELTEREAKWLWLAHAANGVIGTLSANANQQQVAHELTAREREILRWTAAGKTADAIALLLGISTRTVTFHLNAAALKLAATNKTQAVVKAFMLNLLD